MVLTFKDEGQVTRAQPSVNLKNKQNNTQYTLKEYCAIDITLTSALDKPRVQTSQYQAENTKHQEVRKNKNIS